MHYDLHGCLLQGSIGDRLFLSPRLVRCHSLKQQSVCVCLGWMQVGKSAKEVPTPLSNLVTAGSIICRISVETHRFHVFPLKCLMHPVSDGCFSVLRQ